MFKFYLYKFGQFLVRRLSLKSAYRLAMFVSDIHFMMSFRDRAAVTGNLRAILKTEGDVSKEAREVFRNFGKYLVEFFRIANELDENFVREKVRIINRHFLDEAASQKKGLIILTAHIGSWELGGLVMGMLGYPTFAIALPHKERPVNDLFNRQRELRGIVSVPINQAVRRCLAALRENKNIAVLADRDFTNSGEVLDFLGKKMLIPKGAALFALKTGAVILPTFFLRDSEDGKFILHFEAPILTPNTISGQIESKDLIPLITKYKEVIEEKIHQYPTQWLLFREFWNQKLKVNELPQDES